jgi:uncharacterized protein (TIGR02147 family)
MGRNRKISVLKYLDYRFFLQDYYDFRKKAEKKFSYRSFAAGAGVSASLLKDILNGRQNLSLKAMRKYAVAMGLSEKETAYFEALTLFNNAKNNDEKNKYFQRMNEIRGQAKARFLDSHQYEYFSSWYHSVVRELVTYRELENDPEKIAARISPQVTPAQVKKSIVLLEKLGLIRKNKKGEWVQTDKIVSSEFEIQSVALRNYQLEMLRLAGESIERHASENRDLQALTLNASGKMYKTIKERVRIFTDEMLSMVEEETETPEKVFQLNLQLFPFTNGAE